MAHAAQGEFPVAEKDVPDSQGTCGGGYIEGNTGRTCSTYVDEPYCGVLENEGIRD